MPVPDFIIQLLGRPTADDKLSEERETQKKQNFHEGGKQLRRIQAGIAEAMRQRYMALVEQGNVVFTDRDSVEERLQALVVVCSNGHRYLLCDFHHEAAGTTTLAYEQETKIDYEDCQQRTKTEGSSFEGIDLGLNRTHSDFDSVNDVRLPKFSNRSALVQTNMVRKKRGCPTCKSSSHGWPLDIKQETSCWLLRAGLIIPSKSAMTWKSPSSKSAVARSVLASQRHGPSPSTGKKSTYKFSRSIGRRKAHR